MSVRRWGATLKSSSWSLGWINHALHLLHIAWAFSGRANGRWSDNNCRPVCQHMFAPWLPGPEDMAIPIKCSLRNTAICYNAPAHKAELTMSFLAFSLGKLLPHPSNSLDYAHDDFWLFPETEEPFRWIHFDSRKRATRRSTKFWIPSKKRIFNSIPKSGCMQKYVDLNGNYVERLRRACPWNGLEIKNYFA